MIQRAVTIIHIYIVLHMIDSVGICSLCGNYNKEVVNKTIVTCSYFKIN